MSSHADTIRRALHEHEFETDSGYEAAVAALDALVVENQRLRGALTDIDTFPISEELSAGYHFAEVRSIARAALRGTP